ncbi:MAG: hypothetical protein ABEJ80_02670 [Halarchaeum sp.]
MTDNHDLNTPAKGTLDWNVPLNENFERLDAAVEIRDVRANRSNYVPKDGAKFLATDTGRVYLGDGTSWSEIGSIAASGGSAGGVNAALVAGNVVAIASELAAPEIVDPDGTDTPVQDAMDVLGNNGGGVVRLPPYTVSEAGSIRPYRDTAILGFGPDVSKIAITPSNVDGIRFDRSETVSRVRLDEFALNGPGRSADSGVAVHHVTGDTQDLVVGRLIFWGWNNSVYRVDEGVGPFQCRHRLLTVYECDAGDQDGLFEFRSWYGPANWFGTIAAYPTADYSGANTTVFFSRGGTQMVDHLTMGGSAGVAVDQTWDSHLHFGNIHWEPTDLRSTPPAIVRLLGHGPALVDSVKHVTGTTDYVYELGYDTYNGQAPARKRLGQYYDAGRTTAVSSNVVNVAHPPNASAPSYYWGTTDDVDVTHGSAGSGGLRVLGDAGTAMG